jgi:XTP/dITP diphosphohydrolase
MNDKERKLNAFGKLLDTMDELREKCPWDQKQNMETLRPLTIEETFELADAILSGNSEEIKKELGDVILHIVFYAKIASEKGAFDIADVCDAVVEKLIYRHPHIYGDTKVKNEEEVRQNWEDLKQSEAKDKRLFDGVPASLPALVKATRLQEKASSKGFDWKNKEDVWLKVREEIEELHSEVNKGKLNQSEVEAELGDLLFSIVNYARYLNVNPDNALEKTNKKFIYRFEKIESYAKSQGKSLRDMSLEEMDAIWEKAKKKP